MNALSKNYTTNISYPIRYRNFPEDKTLIGEPPDELILKVNAHGYTLLRHKMGTRYVPIVFSVKSFTLNRTGNPDSSRYFIETRYTREYITRQLSSEFEIIEIKPDTIFFPFADVLSKKVPVTLKASYKLGKQLVFKSPPKITPDSIRISGPEYIIDTIRNTQTRETDLGMINSSTTETLGIKRLENLIYETTRVEIQFEIEKFTEKTLSVPVRVLNLPDSLNIKLFPPKISVVCQVGLSKFENLQSSMMRAEVDYNQVKEQNTDKMTVKLENVPSYIKSFTYSPKTVEYLIEK